MSFERELVDRKEEFEEMREGLVGACETSLNVKRAGVSVRRPVAAAALDFESDLG